MPKPLCLWLSSWLIASSLSSSHATQIALPQGDDLPAATETRYAITVYPDGRNLPPGSGSARQGRTLYTKQCAFCHGETGKEGPAARLIGSDGFWSWQDPLRPLRVLKHPLLINSVGAQWPYATTIFDYIRRAMPHHAPKSLQADEVYALTAYILQANGLIQADTTMNAQSLPLVVMPGKKRGHDSIRQGHSSGQSGLNHQAPTPQ